MRMKKRYFDSMAGACPGLDLINKRNHWSFLLYAKTRKPLANARGFPMDQAGIEPASESLFIQASPITVIVLTFPHAYAQ